MNYCFINLFILQGVQLDTKDGISWSILGNAYLAHFFSVSQNPRTLKQAMSAYRQAEKDMIALNTPELHHNKGIVSKKKLKSLLKDLKTSKRISKRPHKKDRPWKTSKDLKYLKTSQERYDCF